jgi:DNA-binding NtrC family response regulator
MTMKRFLKDLMGSKEEPAEGPRSILIVDDDESLTDNLTDILEGEGYEIFTATTSRAAIKKAKEVMPSVALLDLRLPDGLGTALLSDLKHIKPDCLCILITAHADVDSAVVALEKGAFYYLRKPVKPEELVELVELAFETIKVKGERKKAEEALRQRNQELEEIISRLRKIVE